MRRTVKRSAVCIWQWANTYSSHYQRKRKRERERKTERKRAHQAVSVSVWLCLDSRGWGDSANPVRLLNIPSVSFLFYHPRLISLLPFSFFLLLYNLHKFFFFHHSNLFLLSYFSLAHTPLRTLKSVSVLLYFQGCCTMDATCSLYQKTKGCWYCTIAKVNITHLCSGTWVEICANWLPQLSLNTWCIPLYFSLLSCLVSSDRWDKLLESNETLQDRSLMLLTFFPRGCETIVVGFLFVDEVMTLTN